MKIKNKNKSQEIRFPACQASSIDVQLDCPLNSYGHEFIV